MTIKEWLQNQGSFEEGLELFRRNSRNENIVRYLTRKQDMHKLRYELGKIASYQEPVKVPISIQTTAPITPEPSARRLIVAREGGIRPEDLPAPVRKVYDKVSGSYRKMVSLFEKMKLVKSDPERADIRAEIVTLEEQRAEGWNLLDRWAKDKTLPPEADPAVPSDPKSVAAARTSITRNIALLKKAKDPKRIEELVERLRQPVAIVQAAGSAFSENAAILAEHGLI